MSLKDLPLYRSKIVEAICSYPDYVTHKVDSHPNNRFNYLITIKGQSLAMLNVINLVNGNTTLNTEVGKNKELSALIADHVSKCCSVPHIESKRLYIKEMSDELFDEFLDIISIIDDLEISIAKKFENSKQYTISWLEGGCVYVNRYNTKAFSVQGNSNHVKEKLVEILTQVLPYTDVINAQMNSLEVNITSDQVISETEIAMPTAFPELGETIIAIISPSIALRTVNIELTDYSAFTFPILRGIEGILRTVLSHFGIIVEEKVGVVFSKLPNGMFELQQTHRAKIPDVAITRLIDELYNIYFKERHTTFHTNINIQTSRLIEDKNEALEIINESISKIEDLYIKISNAS